MNKRDWQMASDMVAHHMDGLEREITKIKFQSPAWDLTSSISQGFWIEGDEQARGSINFNVKNRDWLLKIDVVINGSRAWLESDNVPAWMIEALPFETKAKCLGASIEGEKRQSDEIPF